MYVWATILTYKLGPRFRNPGCAKSRSDCMYIYMIVVARPYCTIVLMKRTALSVYLYGRCSAIILYTVHARGARAVLVHAQRAGLAVLLLLLLLLLARRRTDAGAAKAAEGEKEKNGAVGQ